MRAPGQPFWLALSLLSVLPVGRLIAAPPSAADLGRSPLYYPLVGLLLGALVGALALLLAAIGVDPRLAAALLVMAHVGLTGALHLDGLADGVDALYAGHRDPERCLAVLRDPAVGPMGAVALMLRLLLEYAALVALFDALGPAALALLLVAAATAARAAALALMATTAYRRREGLASALSQGLSRGAAAAVLAATAALLFAGLATLGLGLALLWLVLAAATTAGWRALWQRAIGGYTGDVVGGLIEVLQVLLILAAALWAAWA